MLARGVALASSGRLDCVILSERISAVLFAFEVRFWQRAVSFVDVEAVVEHFDIHRISLLILPIFSMVPIVRILAVLESIGLNLLVCFGLGLVVHAVSVLGRFEGVLLLLG